MPSFRNLNKAELQSAYECLQRIYYELGAKHNALGSQCLALEIENAKLKVEIEELKRS